MILVLLTIGVGSYFAYGTWQHTKANDRTINPSFNTYCQREEYGQAAYTYPKQAVSAENRMLNDPNITNKANEAAQIKNVSGNDPIRFDNDYFNRHYQAAVNLYQSSNDENLIKLSDARRTMVAYAYLKVGKPDQADKVGHSLHNKQLNAKIQAYQEFQSANKTLQDKLNSGNLSNQDKAKAQKQIQENKAAMKKL